jgi:3-hydroxy-9,10-secoandrosta-1,3,5(10)-triene-9,17-dione monooxygenase
MLRPKRYGGLEFGLRDFLRVAVEIGRGDPGVGWSFTLGAGHMYHLCSYFPEQAQEEALASKPFVAPSRAIPMGTARRVDGGWVLDGTWDYNSGCTWSTHSMPVAPAFDEAGAPLGLRMFLIERADFEILDDWGGDRTIGLQASSSNSITVREAFVPDHRSVPYDFKAHEWGDTGTVGYQLHGNPVYLGRSLFFFYAELISTQVGAGWAALDEYEALLEKGTSFPPRMPRTSSQEYQLWYGRLLSLVETATTILFAAADLQTELNRRFQTEGRVYTVTEDARIRGIVLKAAELSNEAVMLAFQTGGSSAAKRGSRMEKLARDVLMYRTHIGAQFDALYAAGARTVITGEPPTT